MRARHALLCLGGIVWREVLRFLHQRERFLAALVRPLIWLLIFAAGFRAAVDGALSAPDQASVTYEVYIVPGLLGMIQLFNGMQSSLSMVYDREMGSMRILMVTPLPRGYLLSCKLLAGTAVSMLQAYAFLAIAAAFGVVVPPVGYVAVFPALLVSGLMLGAIGLLLSSTIKQLENFAGIMNFVIFPMFFASSALYPLANVRDSSATLAFIAAVNPFTHAVELIRYALYGRLNAEALLVTAGALAVILTLAIVGYSPARSMMQRKARGGG